MIYEMAQMQAARPLSEPGLAAHYREELARESRVAKARKLPHQPTVNTALLRASWILAAGRFARPA